MSWDSQTNTWIFCNEKFKPFKRFFSFIHHQSTESIFPSKDMVCLGQSSSIGGEKSMSQRILFSNTIEEHHCTNHSIYENVFLAIHSWQVGILLILS